MNTKVHIFMVLMMMQSLVFGMQNADFQRHYGLIKKELEKHISGAKMEIDALRFRLIMLKMKKKLVSCWVVQEEVDRIENKLHMYRTSIDSVNRSIQARRIFLRELENEMRVR